MGRKCSILKCSNRSLKAVQVFQLPKKLETKRKWMEFIKTQNKREAENGESFLCFKHFSAPSWKVNKDRSRLKEDAIPSIGCEDEEVNCTL
jgi:hypothetical protein